MNATNIAIACQGGGSHAAYAAGVLTTLLPQFRNTVIAQLPDGALPDEAREPELLNLVGISGTSGGAITALLAWYGFLTGGPQAANEKLDAFWESNCAQWIGERLWNVTVVGLAESLQYDIKFSPYLWPLREVEALTTKVWPTIAGFMGNLNYWMRDNFFELSELIRPHVDFALVSELGDFCSIPAEIERWLANDLEARLYDAAAPHQAQLSEARQRIQERIEHKLASSNRIRAWMNANAVPGNALLRFAFDNWKNPAYQFEAQSLKGLSDDVFSVTSAIPQLLIGAVKIDNGQFTAFSSERSASEGGISLEAVIASASLPWLFQAQKLPQINTEKNLNEIHFYWDGLFSQNPPIKNFVSGVLDKKKKPDGIWVVQINPDNFVVDTGQAAIAKDALSGSEIWHTRDALSGNLSLNQEISFIETINKRIEAESGMTGERDKYIAVHRIVMDGAAVESVLGRKLGVYSKFDRDTHLKAALVEHGKMQASTFLSRRTDVVSSNFGTVLRKISAAAAEMKETSVGALRVIGEGAGDARLIVDGMTVHRQPQTPDAAEPQVRVRWHMRGASVDGSSARVEGSTGLFAAGSADTTWRLSDVSNAKPQKGAGSEAGDAPMSDTH